MQTLDSKVLAILIELKDKLLNIEVFLTGLCLISPIWVYSKLYTSYAERIVKSPFREARILRSRDINQHQAYNARMVASFNKYAIPAIAIYYTLILLIKMDSGYLNLIKEKILSFKDEKGDSSQASLLFLILNSLAKYKKV